MWAYVENNSVVEEYTSLPRNWRNYSNFFALESNVEFLGELGWYTLVDNTQSIVNDFVEYHGAPEYNIDHESRIVQKNRPVLIKEDSSSEQERHAQAREFFLASLRKERRVRLLESDWTQSADLQLIKSDEWKAAWAEYRQALRDLPQVYSEEQYQDVISMAQVMWPSEPKDYTEEENQGGINIDQDGLSPVLENYTEEENQDGIDIDQDGLSPVSEIN